MGLTDWGWLTVDSVQRDSNDLVAFTESKLIETSVAGRKMRCWFDQKASAINKEAMEAGVKNSGAYVLFLSPNVWKSEYVQFEIRVALEAQKPLILIHNPDVEHIISHVSLDEARDEAHAVGLGQLFEKAKIVTYASEGDACNRYMQELMRAGGYTDACTVSAASNTVTGSVSTASALIGTGIRLRSVYHDGAYLYCPAFDLAVAKDKDAQGEKRGMVTIWKREPGDGIRSKSRFVVEAVDGEDSQVRLRSDYHNGYLYTPDIDYAHKDRDGTGEKRGYALIWKRDAGADILLKACFIVEAVEGNADQVKLRSVYHKGAYLYAPASEGWIRTHISSSQVDLYRYEPARPIQAAHARTVSESVGSLMCGSRLPSHGRRCSGPEKGHDIGLEA